MLFEIGTTLDPNFTNFLSGIPLIGESFVLFPIKIPLYLDKDLTGLVIDTEEKALNIETEIKPTFDGSPPDFSQRGVSSLVTVNMLSSRGSIGLSMLLALNDVVFGRLVKSEYRVSYLSGPIVVFGGLLHGFSTSQGIDDDLVRITMQIEKANAGTTIASTLLPVIGKSLNFPPGG